MGYGARMKRAARSAGESTLAGNPEKPTLMATYITVKAHWEAVRAKRPLRAKYSDREYLMDSKGQLRRLRPQPVALSTLQYRAHVPDPAGDMRRAYTDASAGSRLPESMITSGENINAILGTDEYVPEKAYHVHADGIDEMET